MTKHIGVLTAGGDSPGLNAAIRGIGKAALSQGMQVIGFRDGFRGLMENRTVRLDRSTLSGILTIGGTILGTSRDKPHRMPVGSQTMDMTEVLYENYRNHHLDALVCLGGGGTQKNAHRLAERGFNVVTLPKTIDNDVACTDVTFGFDTAMGIATEAIDRLHSTAHSHHRIIVVEVMGHNAGWLTLGAGIAGGADVVLIPEIPYDATGVAPASRSSPSPRVRCPRTSPPNSPTSTSRPATPTRRRTARRPRSASRRSSVSTPATRLPCRTSSRSSPAWNRASRSSDTCSAAGHRRRPTACWRPALAPRAPT
jgi:hypothetical protein